MANSTRQKAASDAHRQAPSSRAEREAAKAKAKQRQDLLKWLAAGLVLAFAAVLIFIFVANQDDDEDLFAGGPESAATVVAGPVLPSTIPLNGTTMGDPSASVIVVEYGDYQCPFCTKFARQDMPNLMRDYVESGKILFQFSELPIVGSNSDGSFNQEGESFRAAEAALCANDRGLYWPYHDILYANTVGEFKNSFTPDRLKTLAAMIPGMDVNAFSTCLDSRQHVQTVLDLGEAAREAGVGSTPTFIVNGKPVIGADYDELVRVIEEQIAGP
jgi:protein-disulfide isomerase